VEPIERDSFTSDTYEEISDHLISSPGVNNLQDDELNLNSFNIDDSILNIHPPKDR